MQVTPITIKAGQLHLIITFLIMLTVKPYTSLGRSTVAQGRSLFSAPLTHNLVYCAHPHLGDERS